MQNPKNSTLFTLITLSVLLFLFSCKKEYETIESIDAAKLQEYFQKNNLTVEKDSAGFYYQILDKGTGGVMLNKDSVFFNPTIKSLSGTIYKSPETYTIEGNYLGYVSPAAYRLAMYHIERGGSIRIFVPSSLAFGRNGNGVIPPNEVLIIDVSVLPETKRWEIDDILIQRFITNNKLTGFTKLPSRVYQNISVDGTGTTVTAGSTITTKYKGRLLDGSVFDQSTSEEGYEQALNNLIMGWKKALVGLKAGTKLRLLIPSDMAYGSGGSTIVPANSILDFDIEITKVTD